MLYGTLKIAKEKPIKQINNSENSNSLEITKLSGDFNIIIGHYDFLLNCVVTITSPIDQKLDAFVAIEKLRYWIDDAFATSITQQDNISLIFPKALGDTKTFQQQRIISGPYAELSEKIKQRFKQLDQLEQPLATIDKLDTSKLADNITVRLLFVNHRLLQAIELDSTTPILSKASDTDVLLQQSIAAKTDLLLPQFMQYWGLYSKHIDWPNLTKEHLATALMFMANNSTYVSSRGVIGGSRTVDGADKPLQYYRSQARHPFFEFVKKHLDKIEQPLQRALAKQQKTEQQTSQELQQLQREYRTIAQISQLLDEHIENTMLTNPAFSLLTLQILQALPTIDSKRLADAQEAFQTAQQKLKKAEKDFSEGPQSFKLISNMAAADEIAKTLANRDIEADDYIKDEAIFDVLDSVSAGLRSHNNALISHYLQYKYPIETTDKIATDLVNQTLPVNSKNAPKFALDFWRLRDTSTELTEKFDKTERGKGDFSALYKEIFDRRIATTSAVFSDNKALYEYLDKDGKSTVADSALVTIFRSSTASSLIQIEPYFLHQLITDKKKPLTLGANNTEVKVTDEGLIIERGAINLTEKIYVNNILSIFIAAISTIADLSKTDLIYMRRQSFGFLNTTLSDTALSIRLSVGIEPTDSNSKVIRAGLCCLAKFFATLKAIDTKELLSTQLKQLHFDGGNEVTEQQLITSLTRAFARKCDENNSDGYSDIEDASKALLAELANADFIKQICLNLEHIHKDGLSAGWDWKEESTQPKSRLTRQNSRNFADSEYQLPNKSTAPEKADALYQKVLSADLYIIAKYTNIDAKKQLPAIFAKALTLGNSYVTKDKGRRLFGLLNIRKVLHDYLPFYIPKDWKNPLDIRKDVFVTDGGQQALVVTCAILMRYYQLTPQYCYFELPSLIEKLAKGREKFGYSSLKEKALIIDPSPTLTTVKEQQGFKQFYDKLAEEIAKFDLIIVDITNTSPTIFDHVKKLIKDKDVIYLASGLKHMQLGIDKYQFGFVYPHLKNSTFKTTLTTALAKVQKDGESPVRDRLVNQFLQFLPFWS